MWWQRLGTCHPKRSKWRSEQFMCTESLWISTGVRCRAPWNPQLTCGQNRTARLTNVGTPGPGWASQARSPPQRGLLPAPSSGDRPNLSSQGHQNPAPCPDFRMSVLHHSTHEEDAASLTFLQQNPPTYNLSPGPADSSSCLKHLLRSLLFQISHPKPNLLILS